MKSQDPIPSCPSCYNSYLTRIGPNPSLFAIPGVPVDENILTRETMPLLPMVLEALPVGVWIMDENGRIIHGNPAGRLIWAGSKYVGIERFGEYKGWWADSGKPIGAHEWAAARAIEKGETTVDELIDIECFDGSRKTILNSAMPIRNPDGKIAGAIIVNQDVTEKRRMEKERDQLLQNLETALAQVKTLSGLLPICASCKKIRDGEGHWNSIEKYIQERTTTKFSHGICPECMIALYPEYCSSTPPS